MSLEEKKALAKLFVESLSDANDIVATTMMSDDATIEWMFRSEGLPLRRSMTKDELHSFIVGSMREFYPNGMRLTVERTTAEGNRVCVEAESHARLNDGGLYNNLYVFMIEIEDGKVRRMREYADFLHAKQTLFANI